MKRLVRWLLARRVGDTEADRFLDELDELHRMKVRADGQLAGDRWMRKELRKSLWIGLSAFASRPKGVREAASGGGASVGFPEGHDGGPDGLKPVMASRQSPGGGVGTLWRDLRFGFRTLRRRPLFAVLVIGTLGLGIGASTTVFSLVDGILLRDMAYEDPGELALIWATYPSWRDDPLLTEAWDKIGLTWQEYLTFRERQQAFSDVGGHRSSTLTLTGAGDPVRLESGEATSSLFPLLGIRPVLGRTFLPGEEGPGAPHLAVLSHDLWKNRFGSDPAILGRSVTLNGQPFEVIGVLPAGVRIHSTLFNLFNSSIDSGKRAVWVPANWSRGSSDGSHDLETIGRLKPGVSREQALADVGEVLLGDRSSQTVQFRLTPPRDEVVAGARSPLFLLLGASGILLLIACANAATLLLGEALDRRGEMAARVALGASQGRIARQLLTESLIMGIGGSLVGILLTPLGLRAFLALGPALPRIQEVEVNQTVLLTAALAGVACAVLFGFAPALLQHKHSIHSLIQKEGRSRMGGSGLAESTLMAGEMALTVVLLVTSGLLGRSLMEMRQVAPGFQPEGVATIRVQVSSSMLGDDRQAQLVAARALQGEVLGRVREIPGIVALGAIDGLPFPGLISGSTFRVRGDGAGETVQVVARDHRASPGYFEAMGIPLLAGGLFHSGTGDEASEPEVLINETMARGFWPDESPLGATIDQGGNSLRIVGIVGDVRERHLTEEPFPMVYRPLSGARGSFSVVVQTRGAPEDMVPLLRDAVRSVAPDVPIAQATTMKALVEASTGGERFRTILVAAFGLMATLLALVGVFGVTARSVAHRNREMGIRMALGARNRGLVRMMALGTLRSGGVGIGLGVLGALAATRLLGVFFFGVRPWDAPTFVGTALLLGVLSVGVATLAAFRVTRVEPMRVLREE